MSSVPLCACTSPSCGSICSTSAPAVRTSRLLTTRSRRTPVADAGFVLLDVLIGIAVLALLLLTAITSIGPMRQRSYQSSATSDARQVGTAIGAALTDHPSLAAAGLPATETALSAADLAQLGVNLTDGVRVSKFVPLGGDDFQVCTIHESGSSVDAYALFDSSAGRITGSGRGAGTCAPTADAGGPGGGSGGSGDGTDGSGGSGGTGGAGGDGSGSPLGDNNMLANAHVVGITGGNQVWRSQDMTNAAADSDPGEQDTGLAKRSMWWTYYAQQSGTIRISIIDPILGGTHYPNASFTVWRSTSKDVAQVMAAPKVAGDFNVARITANVAAGETYVIRLGAVYGDTGSYRLQVESGPGNDALASATVIPATAVGTDWTGEDTGNELAGTEAGEDGGLARQSLWWTYTATANSTIRIRTIATTTGGTPRDVSLWVYRNTSTQMADIMSGPRVAYDWGTDTITWNATAGETYKIRVAGTYGDNGTWRLRLTP